MKNRSAMQHRCKDYTITLCNATLNVPREELFLALSHFAGTDAKRLREMYLDAELTNDEITLTLPTIGIQRYREALYKDGRLRDSIGEQGQGPSAWSRFQELLSPRMVRLGKDYEND